jgi:excisionase family DNA binding protein
MAKVHHSEGLLNTREAARLLSVSEASIRRWSDAGLLRAQRVGRRRERRFLRSELLGMPAGGARPAASTVSVGGQTVPVRSHLSPIYSTDPGGLRLTVPFLAEGIRAGQHCYLAATDAVLERYTTALTEDQDVDVAAARNSGRLTIVGWPGADGAAVIASWERLFGNALAGGPTVLRVVGEMACERAMFASDAEMLAYEAAYELMVRRYPAVTLCQYDARELSGETMLRALKCHPDMFEQHLGGFLN